MSVWGRFFRVSTFGESHGAGVGCVIDGVPPGMSLSAAEDIQPQMARRRPGQSVLTTQRQEVDRVEILSGTENDTTLGTPIAMLLRNQDQKQFDYANTSEVPRPGHADWTYKVKYGVQASSGGGRASARETAARVAAGAVAEKWLRETYGTEVVSWVSSVHTISLPEAEAAKLECSPLARADIDRLGTVKQLVDDRIVDCDDVVYDEATTKPLGTVLEVYPSGLPEVAAANIATRCPHPATAVKIALRIKELRAEGDSIGGIVTTVATNVPAGLGEPCFDKIEAELAKAMMSLPATKGFEVGEGFQAAKMRGSEHNDRFTGRDDRSGLLSTGSNHAGGSLGGITTGQSIVFRVAVKPVSSINKEQNTCDYDGKVVTLGVKGRHDPCVLPRTPPLTEGMTAIVLIDMAMGQRARMGCSDSLKTFLAVQ